MMQSRQIQGKDKMENSLEIMTRNLNLAGDTALSTVSALSEEH